jgi:hypothetical protein
MHTPGLHSLTIAKKAVELNLIAKNIIDMIYFLNIASGIVNFDNFISRILPLAGSSFEAR